ncbi:hypothetical protein, partial [Enterobacter roggenkampii]|uniref:hypothetical protein n=1 Tax=Enterobacter roggenkampii TaxID=1812935 RepID=UPI00197ADE96
TRLASASWISSVQRYRLLIGFIFIPLHHLRASATCDQNTTDFIHPHQQSGLSYGRSNFLELV